MDKRHEEYLGININICMLRIVKLHITKLVPYNLI